MGNNSDSGLTQAELKRLLRYEPDEGLFYWKDSARAKRKNRVAGGVDSKGYAVIGVNRRVYLAHRLAWFYVHGVWPEIIDHINHNPLDNQISNLRDTDQSGNMKNSTAGKNSKSGLVGIYWMKTRGKWRARIKNRGRDIFIGHFDSIDDAVTARKEAEAKYGFHENHGKAVA